MNLDSNLELLKIQCVSQNFKFATEGTALLQAHTLDVAVATLAHAETHCATVVITNLSLNDMH